MYREAYLARRLFIMIVGVTVALVAIWAQVIHLLVLGSSAPQVNAAPERLAPMGTIVDRHGHLLVLDAPVYRVYINGQNLSSTAVEAVANRLAEYGVPEETRARAVELLRAGKMAVVVVDTLEGAQSLENDLEAVVPDASLDWVWQELRWVRRYPNGPLAFHVLGYRNLQNPPLVQGGVHQYYMSFLSACQGLDPDQKRVAEPPGGYSPFFPSPFRCDLALTIDAAVQYLVERELDRAIETYQPSSGTIIVMNPEDGSILALASRPVYDPTNPYVPAEVALRGLQNRAVEITYEPGSVVKAITFAAAYDAGVIGENSTIQDQAELEYGHRVIRNSQGRGYGKVTPAVALAKSLNVATARVAIRMGPHRFYSYLSKFGFGRTTEVDMANEVGGQVRWPNTPKWSQVDLATNSFGQGLSVTPIQLLRAMAVLANGGWLVRPHVMKGYYRDDAYYEAIWPRGQRVIRPETARVVTQWLTGVTDELANLGQPPVPGVRVAGKTGTAEIADEEGYVTEDRNVTFVGYFPADNPRAIVLVMLEKPQTGPNDEAVRQLWAYNTAYPVFVRVAQAIMPYLEP